MAKKMFLIIMLLCSFSTFATEYCKIIIGEKPSNLHSRIECTAKDLESKILRVKNTGIDDEIKVIKDMEQMGFKYVSAHTPDSGYQPGYVTLIFAKVK